MAGARNLKAKRRNVKAQVSVEEYETGDEREEKPETCEILKRASALKEKKRFNCIKRGSSKT